MASHYKLGPIFTPPVISRIEGPLGTLLAPAMGGGTNWPGGSYDPTTQILYVSSNSSLGRLGIVPPDPGQSDLEYIQGDAITGPRRTGGAGSQAGGGQRVVSPRSSAAAQLVPGGPRRSDLNLTVQGLPLLKPPYGTISAIDMNRGEILWQIPHGRTPDHIRNHPALAGLDIPRTGQPGSVGHAGDQHAAHSRRGPRHPHGESGARGAMLRAYDKATGAEVGAVYMPAQQSGSPLTYMHEGRQHIVLAVSGGNYSGELLAYRLN